MNWQGHQSAGSTNNVERYYLGRTRWDKPQSLLTGRAVSYGGSSSRWGSTGLPGMTATSTLKHKGGTWTRGHS